MNSADIDEKPLLSFLDIREQTKISVADVINITKISAGKVKLLESMQFEKLGTPTFAIGYITAYAKAVGFNAEPYITVYRESLTDAEKESVGLPSKNQPIVSLSGNPSTDFIRRIGKSSSYSNSKVVLVLTLVVIFGVIGLGVYIFSDRDAGVIDGEAIDRGGIDEVYQKAPEENADHVITAVGLAQVESVEESDKLTKNIASTGVSVALSDGDLSLKASPESGSVDLKSADVAQIDNELTDISDLEQENDVELVTIERNLTFIFEDECWIEVYDGSEERIFADLKNKGDNLRLSGFGPFNVVLGNARAVTLWVDDTLFDIKPKANRDTLKFTID